MWVLFFIHGGIILTFKTYNPKGIPKDEIDVSKEYTAEEIYKDLPSYTKQDKVLIVDGGVP